MGPQKLTEIDDGFVTLTPADLRLLRDEAARSDSEDETLVDDSDSSSGSAVRKPKVERIVLRNTAKQQSLQVNAAIGEDICKHITRLIIKDNVAEHEAIQINHGNTLEATLLIFDQQDKRIAEARQRASKYQRRDSGTH